MALAPAKRARKVTPHRAPQDVLEIDRKGDLVLKVGSDPAFLTRVSSKHLITVSKVFEILLGPHFREGQQTYTTENPLLLPDDDPESMEMLCKLAHQQLTDESDVKPKQLERLALTCDKYDCVQKFKLFFGVVLMKWLNDYEKKLSVNSPPSVYKGLHLSDALCIAYVVEDAKVFRQISHWVLRTVDRGVVKRGKSKRLLELMPVGFQDALAEQWERLMDNVVAISHEPFHRCRIHVDSQHGGEPCDEVKERMLQFMWQLSKHGLLSPFATDTTHNQLQKFRHITGELVDTVETISYCHSLCVFCREFDFAQEIRMAVTRVEDEVGFMCLCCVKGGNYKRIQTGCRTHKT